MRYYARQVSAFIEEDSTSIIGVLAEAHAGRAGFQLNQRTVRSWQDEIRILKDALAVIPAIHTGELVLEYPIPRRPKRPDAVVIYGSRLAVLEFKIGEAKASTAAKQQVEDYCLDLRDFHSSSAGYSILPVLIPSVSNGSPQDVPVVATDVAPVVVTGADGLGRTLASFFSGETASSLCPPSEWVHGTYNPTPTIIEAACHLYAQMDVREISRSHAGSSNLDRTTRAVLAAVSHARAHSSKTICFVTGVPGAGKTLAGLNIVHNAKIHSDGDLGVFLSGNGPLVRVLREALAVDHHSRNPTVTLAEARRTSSAFVQGVHRFFDEHSEKTKPPKDRVVIFDEAQRAWNAEHSYRKFKRPSSEPELMLEIMDRHADWSVIVGLIGGGQEINTGEAGLREWGRVLERRFPGWTIMLSEELVQGDHSTAGDTLFESKPNGERVETDSSLHLRVSLRSYRAEKLSEWVAHVLDGHAEEAARIAGEGLSEYPLYLTRSLPDARRWLRTQRRGSRRSGLLASSGARRLRPYGIDVTAQLDERNWFLAPPSDIRSSSFLELVATEFAVQGLELDWAGLCWGEDLRCGAQGWSFHQFKGTAWQVVRDMKKRQYMLNKYRVLLTRAREGLIIWVPTGSGRDETRPPEFYDPTAEYLIRCGVKKLMPGDANTRMLRSRLHTAKTP